MKALALYGDYATAIAVGMKTKEYRSWQTAYRGDLLICSTQRKVDECFPRSKALCIVTLSDIVKTKKGYTWHLTNRRLIEPFTVTCKQRLWEQDFSGEAISVEDTKKLNTESILAYWEDLGIAKFD